jgi:prepilin-type N-terminal cleavage/methylation domain-containing protein
MLHPTSLDFPSVIGHFGAPKGAPDARFETHFPSPPASAGQQLDFIMKKPFFQYRHYPGAFTLIELLVVIAIIGILAGLLLPVIGKAKIRAQMTKASTEIHDIMNAISRYESDYSRYPASATLRSAVPNGDFTFGTEQRTPAGGSTSLQDKNGFRYDQSNAKIPLRKVATGSPYENCNAEVMDALLDRTNLFWHGNINHGTNPNKIGYLNAKEVSDPKSAGVGPDDVYRDPWGNPYIISIDLNGDNKCRDAFYRLDSVSQKRGAPVGQGLNGLNRSSTVGDTFEANKPVMVWSFGPDGLINSQQKADEGMNKDNVRSW